MRFKLDVNVGTRGARFLNERGHDVRTASEQALARANDDALLAACASEGRALVTLDLDFANPLRHPPAISAGIVVLRQDQRVLESDIEASLQSLLATVGGTALQGRLLVVDVGGRVREYRPFDP